MKIGGVLLIVVLAIGTIPVQYTGSSMRHLLPQANAVGSHPNLFVSAENSQSSNYFAGPQVIQVLVSGPDINRLDQKYNEPVVTINGKRLWMAQATDGNWYGYFADRDQAIAASNTAPLPGKGLNFGAFCSTGIIGGIDFGSFTKGFTVAEGGFTGAVGLSVTGSKIPTGPLGNACSGAGDGFVLEHVVRENKTLNTNSLGYAASPALESAWPVIQLYDFSAIPTSVTVNYQAQGGDQIVNLTFDRIPSNLISMTSDRSSYPNNAPVFLTINDTQLGIDPTEEDSWTWGANANNNTLFYQAFDRNGDPDADGYCAKNPVSTIPLSRGPYNVAYDSAKGEIFATQGTLVSVISDASNSIVATIPVGTSATGIAYDAAKGEIFVSASNTDNTVSVISDASNSVVATIPVGTDPVDIAYDSAKGEIFVTNISSSTVSVISDASNSVVATIPAVIAPTGIAYDAAKGEIFVASYGSNSVVVISDATNTVVATIPVGKYPSGMTYDETKGEIFVTNYGANTVSVISDATNTVVATIPVDITPSDIAYDSGKEKIFVTDSGSNTVSVISDATNTVVATIPVGKDPSGITYDETKEEIFVANTGSSTASFFGDSTTTSYIQVACGTPGAIPAMQNIVGNLTTFMFNHNGKLTINPFSNSVRVIDFQSNGKQILNGSMTARGDPTKQRTLSISPGSEPITFIEQGGVNTGVFANWDSSKSSNVVIVNDLNFRGMQATFSYNNVSGSIVAQPDKYTILFKSGGFEPPSNTFSISSIQNKMQPFQKVYFLIQFTKIPTLADRAQIASQGITLTDYVTGFTYIAYSNSSSLSNFAVTPDTRWIGPFLPSYKISPILATNDTSKIPPWAILKAPGKSLPSHAVLTVELNKNADMNSVAQNIINNGGTIEAKTPLISSITVLVPLANLQSMVQYIAQIDDVQFIDVVEPPLVEQNDQARAAANVDFLQQQEPSQSGKGLLGDGVTVLLYDGGTVWGHPDFDNRLTDESGSCNETHATHVAGILGGSGVDSSVIDHQPPCIAGNTLSDGTCPPVSNKQWAGMAPHVNIDSVGYDKSSPRYCNSGPPSSDYNDEKSFTNDYNLISTKHLDLASMSIASAVNPPTSRILSTHTLVTGVAASTASYCCLGQYTLTSKVIDEIATGLIDKQNLIIFEAGGNYRVQPFGNYTTIDPPATAKDSIAVGAIDSKDYSILDTSAFGPTSDGRIKPDVTAPGCYGNTTVGYMFATSWLNNENYEHGGRPTYDSNCGTSEATPVAAGVASLLIEKWNYLHPSSPSLLPSTMKAILVHTALDLGNPGPDYEFGWGAINAKAAVELIDEDSLQTSNHLINVANITQGGKMTFNFTSNSTYDVKATLVWDDPPTSRIANGILNQLNLTLIDPSGTHIQPYLLNPSNPSAVAVRGNDTINNVEVSVGNGTAGMWQAVVDGSLVSNGTQSFTLIISNVLKRTTNIMISPLTVNDQTPVNVTATVSDNDNGTHLPVSGSVVFDDGNSSGSFTTPDCTQQNSDLVCTTEYTPVTAGTVSINADYSGDQVHAKSPSYESQKIVLPEFPFAVPIMIASFFSLFIFYKTRLRIEK